MFIAFYSPTKFPRNSIFISIRRFITKIPKNRNFPRFEIFVHIPTSVTFYFFFNFKSQSK